MSALLTAESIRVEFGPLVAVRDISLQIRPYELLGLIGPNGAGKTTLLRVLAGLHAPTRGIARVMGRPVLGEYEIVRQHIGFGPDSPPAYEDITIEQFLLFIAGAYQLGRAEALERIDFWLDQLWLQDKRHTRIKELSKGMRQRVTLARAFLPNPHVILLDEPLSGLDPKGRIQLRQIFTALRRQGCAMVLSSHILADLEEVSTHIAIIEHGRVIRYGAPDALHAEDVSRRTYRVTALADTPDHSHLIASYEGVTGVRRDGRAYLFEYHADDELAASLLRSLIDGNVRVVAFDAVRTSLEQAYLKSGVQQVD